MLTRYFYPDTRRCPVFFNVLCNFINVPRTAFMPVAPQSVRTKSSCQYLFTLLGPTSIKAVRRMLMKLTPVISPPLLTFLRQRKRRQALCGKHKPDFQISFYSENIS